MSNNSETPYDIFPLNITYESESPANIFKAIFLRNSFELLIIDSKKSYKVYSIKSQAETQILFEGKFQDQLADNFSEVYVNGKSLILYQIEDKLFLHDVKLSKTIDSIVFKEQKFAHSSIFQEEFKFRVIPVFQNNQVKNNIEDLQPKQEIPYVLPFWKTSALYKTGNRELSYELRVLELATLSKEISQNQLSSQLLSSELINGQLCFQAHPNFPKPIKIQSQTFLDFTFAFNHPISYQTEGYHLQLTFLSYTGEAKRKLTINSIYNQLIKDVLPVSSSKILIITKHESMNLEEIQQREQEENIVQEQPQNNHPFLMLTMREDEELRIAENELFREDFKIYEEKVKKQPFKEKLNHLFQFDQSLSPQIKYSHFEQEEKVEICCVSLETNNDDEQPQKIESAKSLASYSTINFQSLKLIKLYSSVPIKDISCSLSITPNVVDNMNPQIRYKSLNRLGGNEQDIKNYNNLGICQRQSLQQLYSENIFTKKQGYHHKNEGNQILEGNLLFKVTYSKTALYIKMLQDLWAKDNIKKGNFEKFKYEQDQKQKSQVRNELCEKNQSEINLNVKALENQPSQNPFLETILNLLVD